MEPAELVELIEPVKLDVRTSLERIIEPDPVGQDNRVAELDNNNEDDDERVPPSRRPQQPKRRTKGSGRTIIDPRPRYFGKNFWAIGHKCACCRSYMTYDFDDAVYLAYHESGKQLLCCGNCNTKLKRLRGNHFWAGPLPFKVNPTYSPIGRPEVTIHILPPKDEK